NEEPIAARDRRGFFRGNAVFAEVSPCRLSILDAQGEVARADRVGVGLEQQVQLLIAQIKPEDAKTEGSRLGDLLQAEKVPIEASAPFQIRDQNRDVIDLCHSRAGHFSPHSSIRNPRTGRRGIVALCPVAGSSSRLAPPICISEKVNSDPSSQQGERRVSPSTATPRRIASP